MTMIRIPPPIPTPRAIGKLLAIWPEDKYVHAMLNCRKQTTTVVKNTRYFRKNIFKHNLLHEPAITQETAEKRGYHSLYAVAALSLNLELSEGLSAVQKLIKFLRVGWHLT